MQFTFIVSRGILWPTRTQDNGIWQLSTKKINDENLVLVRGECCMLKPQPLCWGRLPQHSPAYLRGIQGTHHSQTYLEKGWTVISLVLWAMQERKKEKGLRLNYLICAKPNVASMQQRWKLDEIFPFLKQYCPVHLFCDWGTPC